MTKVLLSLNKNRQYYIDAVTGCGADADGVYCPQFSERYDGLILCGGNDISPSYYGEEMNGSRELDSERDKAEFKLLEAFLKAGKPVMGICRGHQLLNVYFGGSLYQHLGNADVHTNLSDFYASHGATAQKGSILHSLYGESFRVNSSHHQAVKRLGDSLEITSLSHDGIAEAFEHKSLPVFGVQWHPERMCFGQKRDDTVDGSYILKYFVDLCKTQNK